MAGIDLGLEGNRVLSVLMEYTVTMQLRGGYFIVIESPLTISAHGRSTTLSPDSDADESFLPLCRLAGQTIDEAFADSTGSLLVRFSDGTRIEVPPDSAYEAWNVSGPNSEFVVCTPGGKLATWSKGSAT